ncbi:amidohydrolase family protein [Clostridium gasigenes]|uniref:amidohydrolase family protein n=1 Tax=Clostridium gasigenes TaxID=94869 RepID=UPI001C0BD1BA|nr:amidohydrolase family protein [Clostridium gasigenes]MBU3107851.1 amidohydrolase family protein [Clostridium gasigenes]
MQNIKTKDQGREAVRKMVAKGVDYIKIYTNIPKNIALAIMDEAKNFDVPVVGHLTACIRAIDASNLGMKSMEHLNGIFIATSTIEEEFHLNAISLIGKMNTAGVPILAGSDSAFLMPNMIYGVALHYEPQLLVKAGLTPLKALQEATLNPAKYLNQEHELGTVEDWKIADLVIIKDNPLEDIKNRTLTSGVGFDGKLWIEISWINQLRHMILHQKLR